MLKMLFSVCIALIFVGVVHAYGLDIIFEHQEQQLISRGITYERNRMMTSSGMLDVHVLIVDLNEPYINVAPVVSAEAIGTRETTTNLISNAGALAGINADFFGLAGAHSIHFGPMVNNGQLLAANGHTNHTNYEFATFFLDMNGNPFFLYSRTTVRFYNNGANRIVTNAYNTIGHALDWPVIVSRQSMIDTSELNTRFLGLTKIVVNNNHITQISQPGETVIVPQNGFVVVLPERMASYRRHFNVGEAAHMTITNSLGVDFASMQMAIGGGAIILADGETMYNRGVAPNTRNPRSAVGVTYCGQYLILIAVDGRSHSIGATHNELAELLRRYGVHNAMHLDGGGSTTLVTSTHGENHAVANTVSDGAQRRVVNALGVFDNAPLGAMANITMQLNGYAIAGIPVQVLAFGIDVFGNRISVVHDEYFTPHTPGAHVIEVSYGRFTTAKTIYALELAELRPAATSVTLFEGQRSHLQFAVFSQCGRTAEIAQGVALSVTPAYLGHFENGTFVAARGGNGFITASAEGIYAFIPVSVSGFAVPIDMFRGEITPLAHPTYGIVDVGTELVLGMNLIRMDYEFTPSNATQAAYVVFYPPLEIPANATALRLQVLGDGSGHWLRARVQDATGRVHLIDFARNADFIGWETVIANLPNAPEPFTIDQIYAVTLNSYFHTRHLLFFYNLEALFAPSNHIEVPQSTQFRDLQHAPNGVDGNVRLHEFVVPTEPTHLSFFTWGGFSVLYLTAADGGIFATDASQWAFFQYGLPDTDYVLIILDTNPLNFRQQMEFELLHLAMRDLAANGREVFVVSATGNETTLTKRDGIRYINLEPHDVGITTIRFWVGDGQIWWG